MALQMREIFARTHCPSPEVHGCATFSRTLSAPPLRYTLFATFFIGWSLLGLEGISLEIESPFGTDFNDLPMDNMLMHPLR